MRDSVKNFFQAVLGIIIAAVLGWVGLTIRNLIILEFEQSKDFSLPFYFDILLAVLAIIIPIIVGILIARFRSKYVAYGMSAAAIIFSILIIASYLVTYSSRGSRPSQIDCSGPDINGVIQCRS